MQFKQPEILYALFALIIPIIVHLFQLQKFVKIPFTNVQFLKKIEQQTRKSARIKKWLILLTRMAAFTCLILAFSQPYFSKTTKKEIVQTSIYLDNSFSMQSKGVNGELLKNSSQKIIESLNKLSNLTSLVTNDNIFSKNNLREGLISIDYSPFQVDLNTVLLQLDNQKLNYSNTLHKKILVSDFQNINIKDKTDFTNVNTPIYLVNTSPAEVSNFYIDSVYTSTKNNLKTDINVVVKSSDVVTKSIPISFFEDTILKGKTTAKFNNETTKIVTFSIENIKNLNGKISLNDEGLLFDNFFYFTISKPEKINTLSVGKKADYLAKIYTNEEFNFKETNLNNLNYSILEKQHLLILNEIDNFEDRFIEAVFNFSKNGGNVVIIPSETVDVKSYNKLLFFLKLGSLNAIVKKEHSITSINYDHPLLSGVFEKRIQNFEYPKTSTHYRFNLNNYSNAISFNNSNPFLATFKNGLSNIFLFTSPINKDNSNFTNSSLIVPVFYNFSKNNNNQSKLYHTISPNTKIEVLTSLKNDEALSVLFNKEAFIPLQKMASNKVILNLQKNLTKDGFYEIKHKDKKIKTVAFNYDRNESDLNYVNLENLKGGNENIIVSNSIENVLDEINDLQKINSLFRWFLAFSALFLLIEMLILKYFKI